MNEQIECILCELSIMEWSRLPADDKAGFQQQQQQQQPVRKVHVWFEEACRCSAISGEKRQQAISV